MWKTRTAVRGSEAADRAFKDCEASVVRIANRSRELRCEGMKVFVCSWPEEGCVHAQQKQGHRRLKRLGQTWGTGHVQSVQWPAGGLDWCCIADWKKRGLDWPGASGRDRDAFGDVGADGGRAFAGGGVGRMLSRWRALQGLAQDSEWPVPRFLQKPNAQKRAFFGGLARVPAGVAALPTESSVAPDQQTRHSIESVPNRSRARAARQPMPARDRLFTYPPIYEVPLQQTNSAHDTPSSAPPALTSPSIPHATPLHCRCHALLFFFSPAAANGKNPTRCFSPCS